MSVTFSGSSRKKALRVGLHFEYVKMNQNYPNKIMDFFRKRSIVTIVDNKLLGRSEQ